MTILLRLFLRDPKTTQKRQKSNVIIRLTRFFARGNLCIASAFPAALRERRRRSVVRIYLRFAFVIARACLRVIQSILVGSLVSLCLLPTVLPLDVKRFILFSYALLMMSFDVFGGCRSGNASFACNGGF